MISPQNRNQYRHRGRFVVLPGATAPLSNVSRRISAKQRRTQPVRERIASEILRHFVVVGERADFIPVSVGKGPLPEIMEGTLSADHLVGKRCLFSLIKTAYLTERKLKVLPRRDVKRGNIVQRHVRILARRRLPDFSRPDEQNAVKRLLLRLRRSGHLIGQSVEHVLVNVGVIVSTYDHVSHTYSYFPEQPSNLPATGGQASSTHSVARTLPQTQLLDDDVYASRVLATALSDKQYSALKIVLVDTASKSSIARVWLARRNRDGGNAVALTHLENMLCKFCAEDDADKHTMLRMRLVQLLKATIELRRSRKLPLFEDDGFWPEGVPRVSYIVA